jgi:hypothetical protein
MVERDPRERGGSGYGLSSSLYRGLPTLVEGGDQGLGTAALEALRLLRSLMALSDGDASGDLLGVQRIRWFERIRRECYSIQR